MEDSTQNNIEEQKLYTIHNERLTRFLLQPGYVEEVQFDQNENDTILAACFATTKEYLVISWNGVPLKLSYAKDLPFLLEGIVTLLENCLDKNVNHWKQYLEAPTYKALWTFTTDDKRNVIINGKFDKVRGEHQKSLNAIPVIKMSLPEFLSEWKLLIEQLIKVIKKLDKQQQDLEIFKRLYKINKKIPDRALRYLY